jgi:hypothetical protein
LAVAILAASCSDSPTEPSALLGEWGGPRALLTLTAEGAVVEFDCAHGAWTAPLRPDRRGRFDVPGYFVQEHGGPIREGEVEVRRPVVYSGEVEGARLTFAFTVEGQALGPYTVARGRAAGLVKCL